MIKINPWINFNGNAEEAFDFYKSILGGEIKKVLSDDGQMMFITLVISNDNMLIANNVPEGMGVVNENENRVKSQQAQIVKKRQKEFSMDFL